MVRVHTIDIEPPVANASCAWASDLAQLRELYDCPHTGAVTTRTATLNGFEEDASNTVVFSTASSSSLNSYGYSPHPLSSYISWIYAILTEHSLAGKPSVKPIIISITASDADTLNTMVAEVRELRLQLKAFKPSGDSAASVNDLSSLVAIEINTSCPNIKGKPPLSYNFDLLRPLLDVLAAAHAADPSLTIGLKLPPYVHAGSFHDVVNTLASYTKPSPTANTPTNPFSFLTCTNTLGSSLFCSDEVTSTSKQDQDFALPTPLGGLGGEALHALALGNVYSFTQLLAKQEDLALQNIVVFGVGGVVSKAAAERMRKAGAWVVECATLLGRSGVEAFALLQ